MQLFRTSLLSLFVLLSFSLHTVAATQGRTDTRAMPPSYGSGTEIFNNPKYRGYTVDKCLYSRGDRQCGKPAADRFCELNGYRESITYDLHERAGNTFLLGSESRCTGTHCDAFRAVACRERTNTAPGRPPAKPPTKPPANGSGKFYTSPSSNGFPVDRCLYRGRACGKPAADEFCRVEGYKRADSYRIIGSRNSWYLKEKRSCSRNCEAISAVQCSGKTNQGDNSGKVVLYEKPVYRGIPADECLRQDRDCGAKAAEQYCRNKGHASVVSYASSKSSSRTWLIGESRYCSGNNCRALRNIRCQSNNNSSQGQDFFAVPEYRGRRVARCLTKGNGCGQATADEFCRLQGFRSASKHERWRDAGPTIRLGNQQICEKRSCDALKNIQCSYNPASNDPGYNREKEFLEPSYQGFPISRCLYKGEGCQQEAADEFCRISGYNRSTDWQLRESIGPTIRLGSRQLCNKRECDGFWNIICRN